MIQRILSFILFSILFISVFVFLNMIFKSPHFFINTSEDFKDLAKKSNIDVIFYGSSHTFTAYNPLIINHSCNTISYNLGSDAQRVPITNLVIEESLKFTKPKLVILELYSASIKYPENKRIKDFQLSALSFISPFSKKKLNLVKNIYEKKEFLGVYSPLIKNHSKWNNQNFYNLSNRKHIDKKIGFYYDGYIGFKSTIKSMDKEKYKNFRENYQKKLIKKQEITTKDQKELIKFVSIAQNYGANVLIVSSPDLRANFYHGFFENLKKLSDSLNTTFLNLNDYYDEIGLTVNDFKDKSHLNIQGSTKTSLFLAKYINQNYSLPNRGSDKIWSEKMKHYKDFYIQKTNFNSNIEIKKQNFKLIEGIVFKEVNVSKKEGKFLFTINIDENNSKESMNKYKLAVNIYPDNNELNLLSDYSKSKKRKFESIDLPLNSDKDSIHFKLSFKFKKIKRVKLFLYDKNGFKGIVGAPLFIESPILD